MYILPLLRDLHKNSEFILLILLNCTKIEYFQPLTMFVINFLFDDNYSDFENYDEILYILNKTLEKELKYVNSPLIIRFFFKIHQSTIICYKIYYLKEKYIIILLIF